MLSRRWSKPLRFKAGSDGTRRPYLWVTVRGPNGREIEIQGLVDSGADKSVLPREYAPLLGYTKANLKLEKIDQVEGEAKGEDAQVACMAYVRGRPEPTFAMKPLFVDTLDALWGRGDLMRAYAVTISERDGHLRLRRH